MSSNNTITNKTISIIISLRIIGIINNAVLRCAE